MTLAPRDRLIVALDVASLGEAEALLDRLEGVVSTFKVGSQLFTAAGPAAVELVRKRGSRVFLDLKYHDIPSKVAAAVREAARLGVTLLTVHASGGSEMLRAAAGAGHDGKGERPRVLAVTVLTSLGRPALQRELGVAMAVEGHVVHLATLAREAGCDGVVASPQEARRLRAMLGPDYLIVTPGIRPASALSCGPARLAPGALDPRRPDGDDQVRIATAGTACRAGADYLVVGRPITAAADPAAAAAALVAEIAGALA